MNAHDISGIRFHKHFDLATGTLVYIYFTLEGKQDLVVFNFRERHLFLLEFAVLNGIPVDTGGLKWLKEALKRQEQ